MITKIQNIIFSKSKAGNISNQLRLANSIIKAMGCSIDDRSVLAVFNGESIVIRKAKEEAFANKDNIRLLNFAYSVSSGKYMSAKLILPVVWLRTIGVTPENRTVTVQFDEDSKILTIRKDVE